MSLFSKDVGIDLGTANTLVYMKGKGIIMREPSVVAVDTKSDEVRCVGAEAKAVIGRTPGSIVAVRPLKDGVIADFDITANMLETFLKKACGNSMFSRPRVVICIPSGVTEVERRAVREAALKAGARQVSVIEEPMAAAIGAGLPISEPTGSMIVDIGGGTAEIAVISLGGIVASRSVRMAGDMFDQAIIAFIKRKYNLLIGERTAEQIKIEIGSAYALDPEMTMEIKGRNLVDGLPKNIVVHSEDVREATLKAGARQVSVIEEPMAAAIGAGLPISEPTGSMIVDIGGGTAEIAVISLGGIVASRSVRMAGDMFDQAIIAFIKRKYNLLIGERTAEQIKIEIGSAYVLDPEMTMEIKGRNLVDGLPKNIVVHSEDVREALLECLVKITSAIKETLERTPPELSADIIDRGITLTGGGALLRGLDQLIQSETGIDVHIAEDPLDCVAKGAGAVLDHVDVLHDVLDTDGGHM